MLDVITMGSNIVDAFANTDAELIEIRSKSGEEELIAYPMGSKILINELHYDIGGFEDRILGKDWQRRKRQVNTPEIKGGEYQVFGEQGKEVRIFSHSRHRTGP